MQRVKAQAPQSFKAHVNDAEKRLNILYDHLNNEDLLKEDTTQEMVHLSQALRSRDFSLAQAIHLELLTNKTEECGNWMVSNLRESKLMKINAYRCFQVGVKRLIGMSKATP